MLKLEFVSGLRATFTEQGVAIFGIFKGGTQIFFGGKLGKLGPFYNFGEANAKN